MESRPSRSTIVILKLAAASGLFLLVWMLSSVLLMVFAAILVAIAYRGSAEWIAQHTGLPVGWSLVLVAILFLAFIGGTAWWTGGTLLDQLGQFWSQLQDRLAYLHNAAQRSAWGNLLAEYFDGQRLLSGVQALARNLPGPP